MKNDRWDHGKGDHDPLIQDSVPEIKGYDCQEFKASKRLIEGDCLMQVRLIQLWLYSIDVHSATAYYYIYLASVGFLGQL